VALEYDLKKLIIDELKIEDITPEDIGDEEPLFGEGL
jgi:acyl carrier protein